MKGRGCFAVVQLRGTPDNAADNPLSARHPQEKTMTPDTPPNNNNDDPLDILNSRQLPSLLMQAEPRQVVTANKQARELFHKGLSEIENLRGGQVFDCIHSFTEKGCGLDENCEDCKIKGAVVDTFASGNPHNNVETVLDIKKQDMPTTPYAMIVSTEKVGDFVLITVLKYDEKP